MSIFTFLGLLFLVAAGWVFWKKPMSQSKWLILTIVLLGAGLFAVTVEVLEWPMNSPFQNGLSDITKEIRNGFYRVENAIRGLPAAPASASSHTPFGAPPTTVTDLESRVSDLEHRQDVTELVAAGTYYATRELIDTEKKAKRYYDLLDSAVEELRARIQARSSAPALPSR